ncbi:adenosine deaminase [Holotrichia oblita]|uniref:Adenosine deaminase n=1 Tax=Holotrichia oblita TaxID=644536 RepID=A0ACB9TRF3_HOLOL|nr:adenosine deaminase [Holotrichia oblita]
MATCDLCTTSELLEEIEKFDENDVVPHSIYISPPDDHSFEIDADSGDEDCNDPDRLNAKQLLSQAETNIMCSEDEDEVGPGPNKKSKSVKIMPKSTRRWERGDLELGITSQINEEKLPVLTLSASSESLEFFELFLSPSVVNLLVKSSVMYALGGNQFVSGIKLGLWYFAVLALTSTKGEKFKMTRSKNLD